MRSACPLFPRLRSNREISRPIRKTPSAFNRALRALRLFGGSLSIYGKLRAFLGGNGDSPPFLPRDPPLAPATPLPPCGPVPLLLQSSLIAIYVSADPHWRLQIFVTLTRPSGRFWKQRTYEEENPEPQLDTLHEVLVRLLVTLADYFGVGVHRLPM
jgi:hypothetical protein